MTWLQQRNYDYDMTMTSMIINYNMVININKYEDHMAANWVLLAVGDFHKMLHYS